MRNAIVLLNMGGPNNLDEVEVFLKNMFTDKNIISIKSNILRRFIANMITRKRKGPATQIYKELGGKSPIVELSKELVEKLDNKIADADVYYCMRYTPPFSDEVVKKLSEKKYKSAFLIPLYPQYSSTTTKSSLEDFEEALMPTGIEAIRIENFYENELYNEAILERIKEQIKGINTAEYDLVFSAHGLPQKVIDKGDPYQKEIEANVEILKQILVKEDIVFKDIHLAYQSKVGPMKWLEPSLEDKLLSLKSKKVIIYPIAFIVDNSETFYELGVEYKEVVEKEAFEDYRVCNCVNAHPKFLEALNTIYQSMKAY